MRGLLTTVVAAAPAGRWKNAVLRRLGHHVGRGAVVGPNLVVGVGRLSIGDRAVVGSANVFRGLVSVDIGDDAVIGQFNWFSAAPTYLPLGAPHGTLRMADHSTVVSRHYIDCSGGVLLESFALLGGLRSTLLTHQANATTGALESAPICIGAYSLVNAHNQLVMGTVVPPRSITGIGAVLLPGLTEPGHVYAGVPARAIKPVDPHAALFTRTETTFGLPAA